MAYAEIAPDTGRVVIQTRWEEKDLIKQLPGCHWDGEGKFWHAPLTWATCVVLRGIFGSGLDVGPSLNTWAWNERHTRVDPVMSIREATAFSSAPETANDHDKRLYPFQVVGREFLRIAGSALLADEMGTGKTIQILAALRIIPDALPALVVCPNGVKRHWEAKTREWFPEGTPYVLAGSTPERRKILEKAKSDPTALVIVNIESVRLLSRLAGYGSISLARCRECDKKHGDPKLTAARCEVHKKELNGFGFKTCILDEAHRVKDPKAKQTRAVWATFHDPSVLRRWGATGTPIANHPGDLWSAMHAVTPDEMPVKSKFLERFAMLSWNAHGGLDVTGLRADTRDEFFRFFDPHFRRMTKDIVLPQLPPKIRQIRTVEMTPKQRKAYKEIEDALATRLEDGSLLVARGNLPAQTRLLQLASSYAEVETITCRRCKGDRRDPQNPAGMCQTCRGSGLEFLVEPIEPSTKVDDLVEIVREGYGRPLAAAAEHRKLIELAAARLEKESIPHALITGTVPEKVRARNIERFQAGEIPVIMFTYKAGGVGIDLSRADTLIRLQRSWSMVDNLQGEDRVHRIGSEIHDSVLIIDLIAEGTVEEDQVANLSAKMDRLDEITRDRARRAAAGLATDDLDREAETIANSYLGE
jgi:SNF2 family DNA or RNA helicase